MGIEEHGEKREEGRLMSLVCHTGKKERGESNNISGFISQPGGGRGGEKSCGSDRCRRRGGRGGAGGGGGGSASLLLRLIPVAILQLSPRGRGRSGEKEEGRKEGDSNERLRLMRAITA